MSEEDENDLAPPQTTRKPKNSTNLRKTIMKLG